jgi:hypothetical protein
MELYICFELEALACYKKLNRNFIQKSLYCDIDLKSVFITQNMPLNKNLLAQLKLELV